jgi:hypothetical protein
MTFFVWLISKFHFETLILQAIQTYRTYIYIHVCLILCAMSLLARRYHIDEMKEKTMLLCTEVNPDSI